MTRKGAVYTIIAKNYLAHARCLMDSVALFHPELRRIVVLADRVDGFFDPGAESFEVLPSEALDIPNSQWFHFKYTLLELSTAVKPYAMDHLLRRWDLDFAIYLDPDILVTSSLAALLERLDRASVLLTPHLTGPLGHDSLQPSELDILRAGSFNLGFVAVSRMEETLSFIEWWKQRLYEHCVVDLPRGLFVDQRWMDFAPSFLSNLEIVRDPQYNVGYWNLSQRSLCLKDGIYLVNGIPLSFFHFSGFDPFEKGRLSKYQNRHLRSSREAIDALSTEYQNLLLKYGYEQHRDWPYAFAIFENGQRIPDIGRSVHRECPDIAHSIENPFSEDGYREFVRIWNEPIDTSADGPVVTRLAYKLYRTRSDLQAAMPDIFNGDHWRFVRWLTGGGTSGELQLPDVFLAPFKANSVPENLFTPNRTQNDAAIGAGDVFWRAESERSGHGGPPLARAIAAGAARLALTRLAQEIYDKRPDLQVFFPDPCGRDSVKYLLWLLTFGKRQYTLSAVYLFALRRQWQAVVNSLPNPLSRLRYRALLFAATVVAKMEPAAGRFFQARLHRLVARRSPADSEAAEVFHRWDKGNPPQVQSEGALNAQGADRVARQSAGD